MVAQMTPAQRTAFLNPKRKRRYSRKPSYARKTPRASLTEGGVNGGHALMVPNILPPVQEVKFNNVSSGGSVTTPNAGFNIISGTSLLTILEGSGASNRIGRNIRVVGVVVRALINTEVTVGGNVSSPSTLDLVWDNQCNGAVATVAEIYSNPTSGVSLPNPLFDKRFKFAKRVQIRNPQSPLNVVDFSYNCNKVIEYKSSTAGGSIVDLTSTNLYLIMSTPGDASAQIDYQMRILYVDA